MKFFRKLLKDQQIALLRIVTDKLRGYSAEEAKLYPALIILLSNKKTTAVNCLISLVDNRKGRRGNLNPQVKLNDFSRVMV